MESPKRVVIVHQWMSGANGDWRPWLKEELENKGFQVLLPNMPDIDRPIIQKWVGHLRDVVGKTDVDTFFVGHSIGSRIQNNHAS